MSRAQLIIVLYRHLVKIQNLSVIGIVTWQILKMKCPTGYCFSFGSEVLTWSSKKQEVTAQSTAKAEHVALNATVNQAIWIRKILADLNMQQTELTRFVSTTKLQLTFQMILFFMAGQSIFQEQMNGKVILIYCTSNQTADVLTKALPKARIDVLRGKARIDVLRDKLGLCLLLRQGRALEVCLRFNY